MISHRGQRLGNKSVPCSVDPDFHRQAILKQAGIETEEFLRKKEKRPRTAGVHSCDAFSRFPLILQSHRVRMNANLNLCVLTRRIYRIHTDDDQIFGWII